MITAKHRYDVKKENQPIDFSLAYKASYNDSPIKHSSNLQAFFPLAYDQGQEGSCTGNGWAGMWDFMQLKDLRENLTSLREYEFSAKKYVPASRQFIYYCERAHEGDPHHDNGAMVSSGAWVFQNVGCADETVWPYSMNNWATKPSSDSYAEAAKHKIPTAYTLSTLNDVLHCISNSYPVVLGMTVFEELESEQVAESGMLPDPGPNSQEMGGHCVVIAGHDMSKQLLKVRNSWGTPWGIDGYFWMSFNYFENYCSALMTLRK